MTTRVRFAEATTAETAAQRLADVNEMHRVQLRLVESKVKRDNPNATQEDIDKAIADYLWGDFRVPPGQRIRWQAPR
jgi:hypothetical protein